MIASTIPARERKPEPIPELPKSSNGELQKLWKKVKPYDHEECFQNQQSFGDGWVHPVAFLPGADRVDPKALPKRSNPHEFPWVHTAGFDRRTQKYYHLPEGEHIEYTNRVGKWDGHGDVERVIEWRFPAGTVFVETLTTRGRVFEVRTRTKTGEGSWRANVYRPYSDAADLKKKLLALGTRDAKTLAAALDNLPRTYLEIKNPHDEKTFEFKGYREDLPEIPESLATTILSWDFEANAEWKTDCFAPSTKSDSLSIVSKDYQGCIVRPDSKGCAQCHDSTLGHTFKLERNRDWYGRVRGSDGIFSFHIFDNTTFTRDMGLAADGKTPTGSQVKLNKALPLKAVEKFSEAYSSTSKYPGTQR